MKHFKLVRGKEYEKRARIKTYMKITESNSIYFYKVKPRIYKWGPKFGPYNTIKQEAGSATFYDVSKTMVNIHVIEEINIDIDPRNVAINCNF